ncbi:MAG: hypothetical protein Ct9H300mP22_7020 [Gammaproteobacteria bacterium]|nr:MAG: hypothetical protein Ct9H300mP22_7020 [Gammaproteobacteria bacterium]
MKKLVVALTFAITLSSCSDELSRARPYVLTTATTGGKFFSCWCFSLATFTHAQLYESEGISLTAISSAGSMENLKLLRDNQVQFAILQGPFGAWSWTGEGPVSRPQTHIRSVSALWKNVEHFVLLTEITDTKFMMDLDRLDDERYVLGARNSGAEQTGKIYFRYPRYRLRRKIQSCLMGYGPTSNAIQDGNIVGMNIPARGARECNYPSLCIHGRTHDYIELDSRLPG